MIRAIKTVAAISALWLAVSCGNSAMYDCSFDMPGEKWNRDSVLTFKVEVTDTVTAYNILFCNRISGQYPYSNMFLFITIEAPDHSHQTDTLECMLADKRGKWLGKGFGSVWFNSINYRNNIIFPRKGVYKFHIEQAMRVEDLPHVLDAGLKIEKASR